MRVSDDIRQQRIQDIVTQINRLSAEISSLLLDANEQAQPLAVVDPAPEPPCAPASGASRSSTLLRFQVGDRIHILNNRNGLQGQTGTVTRTSVPFV